MTFVQINCRGGGKYPALSQVPEYLYVNKFDGFPEAKYYK